jgi:4-diphosphocytidyl-2-C-methyl-D-erythritol kinase
MISEKSYSRITLALDIVEKIKEGDFKGFHKLNIIKHQINLYDTISIEDSKDMEIMCNKHDVPLDNKNICWKVIDLIKNEFRISKNVLIKIDKKIPVEGGLAGGSTNAATTIKIMNELWELGMGLDQMIVLGRKIGMDVPYYFFGKTAFDTEIPDQVERINTDLKYKYILGFPEIGVPTKEAYSTLDYNLISQNREKTTLMFKGFMNNDPELVKKNLHNDFEYTIFKKHAVLGNIKDELKKFGCGHISMSGSGSTIFAIIKNNEQGKDIQNQLTYKSIITSSY